MGNKSNGDHDPRFLVDAMLGRLAKWLRLLGYDATFARRETDHQIAALARAQGRVVLTRDREMLRRKGIRCTWIESEVLDDQVRQVVEAFGWQSRAPRCPRCNAALGAATTEEARPHVPAYVARTQDDFYHCASCDRFYWAGTHWQGIEAKMAEMLGSEGV